MSTTAPIAWLKCRVTFGQFSNGYAIVAESNRGEKVSLFAPRDFVILQGTPHDDVDVDGLLKVNVVDRMDDIFLIEMPVQALENGRTMTVSSTQLQNR